MADTREDLHPTARDGVRDWIPSRKDVGKFIAFLIPAIISGWTANHAASGDGEARAQAAKQLAEDGYQDVRKRVTALEKQVWVLETAARAIQVAAPPRRTGARRAPPAPAIIPVTVTPRPKPLPANLDEVQRQINRPNPAPPAAPKTDATPAAP